MQYGDNTDGMTFFPLSADRAVLVANNEYTNNEYLYPHQAKISQLMMFVKARLHTVFLSLSWSRRTVNGKPTRLAA